MISTRNQNKCQPDRPSDLIRHRGKKAGNANPDRRRSNNQVTQMKEENVMEILRPAVAGTLESSDCQVTVEEGDGTIELTLDSAVINQYGNQIKKVVYETLGNLGVDNVRISIVDKGALDCTIKARIEGAVYRSIGQIEHLPWGGAIR